MNALDALLSYDIAPLQVSKGYNGEVQVEYFKSYVVIDYVLGLQRIYGYGKTVDDACEDYLGKINGHKMSFELANGARHEITVNFKDYKTDKKDDGWGDLLSNLFVNIGEAYKFFTEDKMTMEEALNIVDPSVIHYPSGDKNTDNFKRIKASGMVVDYARKKLKAESATDKKEDTNDA